MITQLSRMYGSMETLPKSAGRSPSLFNKEKSVEISLMHKMLLRRSWKFISLEFSKTKSHVGGLTDNSPTDVFIEMFQKYPESRDFFVQFKGATVEEIQANSALFKELKEHSARVFQLVGKVIHYIDHNLETVGFISTQVQIGIIVFLYNMLIAIFDLHLWNMMNFRQRTL